MRTQQSGLGGNIPPRASKIVVGDYGLEEEDVYYNTRPHTSARRYDLIPGQDFQQGNRTFHVHQGAPPAQQRQQRPRRQQYLEEEREPRRHYHPLVWFGFAIFIMIAGWIAISAIGNLWQQKQDDWIYGQNPRTYQTDAVVGHGDSPNSPTHFIAENLNGQIIVIEISRSDPTKARRYNITTVENNVGNPPVKISFQDTNADGKLDMLVEIGDPGSSFTVILLNNGTQFVSRL